MNVFCGHCAQPFDKKNANHKYCSSSCRKKAHRAKKGKPLVPDFSKFRKETRSSIGITPISINTADSYILKSLKTKRDSLISQQILQSYNSMSWALMGAAAGGFLAKDKKVLFALIGGVGGYMFGAKADSKQNKEIALHNSLIQSRVDDIDYQINAEIEKQKADKQKFLTTMPNIEQTRNYKSISATELNKVSHKNYQLDGKWRYFLGYLPHNFSAIIYGKPKAGKTHLSIQLAQYLQSKFGNVVYVSGEEGIEEPFTKKVHRYNGTFDIVFDAKGTKGIKEAISKLNPKFVFIDSLNRLGLNVDDVRYLKDKYPDIVFFYVLQATKDGRFRGSLELEHEVTATISVEIGNARHKGRTVAEETELKIFDLESTGN